MGQRLLVALTIALVLLLGADSNLRLLGPLLLIPIAVVYVIFIVWHLIDWRNDYYAVTNRRISYREHVALLYDSRIEAPLDQLQQINVSRGFLGGVLGYGTVSAQTAGETDALRYQYVTHPEIMRQAIFEQMDRSRATRQAVQRWQIRQTLDEHLKIDHSKPEEALPATPEEGNAVAAASTQPIDLIDADDPPRDAPGLARRALDWISGLEVLPRMQTESPEQVTWRKHWIFLVLRIAVPLALTLVLAVACLLAFFSSLVIPSIGALLPYALLVLTLIAGFTLVYQYMDWANDLYIVTDARIIDIEEKPFLLKQERREANLARIQNVHYVVPNVFASLLRYGSVVIQTAGQGDFTFDRLPHPAEVQNEIFRRIQRHRDRLQEQESAERRKDMAAWFTVYDEMSDKKRMPEDEPVEPAEPEITELPEDDSAPGQTII